MIILTVATPEINVNATNINNEDKCSCYRTKNGNMLKKNWLIPQLVTNNVGQIVGMKFKITVANKIEMLDFWK